MIANWTFPVAEIPRVLKVKLSLRVKHKVVFDVGEYGYKHHADIGCVQKSEMVCQFILMPHAPLSKKFSELKEQTWSFFKSR